MSQVKSSGSRFNAVNLMRCISHFTLHTEVLHTSPSFNTHTFTFSHSLSLTRTHTHTHTCTHMHTLTHTHIYTHFLYTHSHSLSFTPTFIHTHIHSHIHSHPHSFTHSFIHLQDAEIILVDDSETIFNLRICGGDHLLRASSIDDRETWLQVRR